VKGPDVQERLKAPHPPLAVGLLLLVVALLLPAAVDLLSADPCVPEVEHLQICVILVKLFCRPLEWYGGCVYESLVCVEVVAE